VATVTESAILRSRCKRSKSPSLTKLRYKMGREIHA